MKTLDIVIYTGIIVWSLIEYYYLRFRRSGNGDQKVTDKIGLQRLWIIACFHTNKSGIDFNTYKTSY
ncbi:hypothetical protein M9991_04670 [Chryseobacterium gallinarum]|uniref:hypothetical protein n=1 Tax=Chryseobacterium gallinarum TaxID=1324352 RepID=UPI002024D133|nr:hypothetical protein [Chryseobacterium gallinarum]MCL8536151.1 hypothetical protein [Chryseobacterium gallinarum]